MNKKYIYSYLKNWSRIILHMVLLKISFFVILYSVLGLYMYTSKYSLLCKRTWWSDTTIWVCKTFIWTIPKRSFLIMEIYGKKSTHFKPGTSKLSKPRTSKDINHLEIPCDNLTRFHRNRISTWKNMSAWKSWSLTSGFKGNNWLTLTALW